MASTQNSNAPTNSEHTPVSFSDVSLDTLKGSFNDTYKVSKGSASQLVLGFQSMSERLQEPTNEYQQTLYPQLKHLCSTLYAKYSETFLTTFTSDVERQVFGANLNGNRNTGSLYRSIPSGVNKNLSYNYAQFGQLVRVLTSRLRFISQRDPNNVQRYKNDTTEFEAYQKLQTNVNTFMTYLEGLSTEWNKLVTETRTKFSVNDQSPSPSHQHTPRQNQQNQRPPRTGEQRPVRQQRTGEPRPPRTGEQRPPRTGEQRQQRTGEQWFTVNSSRRQQRQ